MQLNGITIALVFHNEKNHIEDWVSSIKKLYLPNSLKISILLIDNASTDSSSTFASKLALSLDIKYVRLVENNLARARQYAVENSTHDWLAFLDADCRPAQNWVLEATEAISKVDTSTACIGGISNYVSTNQLGLFLFLLEKRLIWSNPKKLSYVDHMPSNNLLINIKKVINIRFDESYKHCGEDLDFSMQTKLIGLKIALYPGMSVHHIVSGSHTKWLKKMYYYGQAQAHVFKKRSPVFPLTRFSPLLIFLILSIIAIFYPLLFFIFLMCSFLWLWATAFSQEKSIKSLTYPLFMYATVFSYSLGEFLGLISVYLNPRFNN